jgi:hypothetical protein
MGKLAMIPWLQDAGGPLGGRWAIVALGVLAAVATYFLGRWLFGRGEPRRPDRAGAVDEEFLCGVTRDRRTFPRREGNSVEVLLRRDAKEEPILGWVIDRSTGGIRVMTDRPVPARGAWQIRPSRPDKADWIDVVVRSCRQEDEQYEVGLQFQSTPNWSNMREFG